MYGAEKWLPIAAVSEAESGLAEGNVRRRLAQLGFALESIWPEWEYHLPPNG